MALRDLIPWSRQENRLSAPVRAVSARNEPFHPLLSFQRDMNRMFDEVFQAIGLPNFDRFSSLASWPHIELAEDDETISVIAELAGLDERDISIHVEEDALILAGEKRGSADDKERVYSERSYGRFERRVGLPHGIDRDQVSATFTNGLLTVTLPKSEAANENFRRIPVNDKVA